MPDLLLPRQPGRPDPGDLAAYALVGAMGSLSVTCSFTLLLYLGYCILGGGRRSPLQAGVRKFVRTPLGHYFLSLMIADFLQGFGFATNFHWVVKGDIVPGTVCTMQGVVKQTGDLGTSLWSFAIAVHTFWLTFLQRKPPNWLTPIVIVFIWSFDLAMPILGSFVIAPREGLGAFWGPASAWCWIANNYQVQRLPMLYAWVFACLFLSFIIYTLVYLKFTGIIDTDVEGRPIARIHWSKKSRPRWTRSLPEPTPSVGRLDSDNRSDGSRVTQHVVMVARRLMWYPIIYMVIVVPLAVCRLAALAGHPPPFWLYVLGGVCFASSGVCNAALFMFTRHTFIQRVLKPQAILVTTHHHSGGLGGGAGAGSGAGARHKKRTPEPTGTELRFTLVSPTTSQFVVRLGEASKDERSERGTPEPGQELDGYRVEREVDEGGQEGDEESRPASPKLRSLDP